MIKRILKALMNRKAQQQAEVEEGLIWPDDVVTISGFRNWYGFVVDTDAETNMVRCIFYHEEIKEWHDNWFFAEICWPVAHNADFDTFVQVVLDEAAAKHGQPQVFQPELL